MATKLLHLVRHAESFSNAGLPTEEPGTYPITDAGRAQAERFAASWGPTPPALIVTSPYVRTQMTAAPFREKFPAVPHETWTVQEWTFLCPSRYKGSTFESRKPAVREFWNRNDPAYSDGGGAETFVELFRRVGRMFDQASNRPEGVITVFTHGHFMRAVLWSLLFEARPETQDSMDRFRKFTEAVEVPNLAMLTLQSDGNEWKPGGLWHVGRMWRLVQTSG